MASIEDIRVDGQQTEITTPTVGTLHPVISWDFIEDSASPSQLKFELQIGTSSVNHGSNLFSANVIDIAVESTANSYEYTDHNILRGITYYGQVRAIDIDGDATLWGIFIFKTNHLLLSQTDAISRH